MRGDADDIEDDELLYRRIPCRPEYHNPGVSDRPSWLAFNPMKQDTTGLSLYRAKATTPERVASAGRGKGYYVGVLRAGDIRRHEMRIVATAGDPGGPAGHVEIIDLTYDLRKSDRVRELEVLLADKLCLDVLGPFTGGGQASPHDAC